MYSQLTIIFLLCQNPQTITRYQSMLRQGRSEFLLRAEPERERGRLSEEIKTARAWPRAAQHFHIAIKKILSTVCAE